MCKLKVKQTLMLSAVLIVLMLSIGLVSAQESKKESKKEYKIGLATWIAWSGAQVAEAKGFWEKRGVKAKVFAFESDAAQIKAMNQNLLDAGFFMIGSAVDMYQNGEPVVIIAETDWSNGGDKIVVKKDKSLKEMKGKAVGVYLNQTCVTFFLNKYLSGEGLKISDFKVIEFTDTNLLSTKFIDGTLSAIVNYEPDASRAEKEGGGKIAATTANYEACMPEGIVARKDKLSQIPKEDLVKIFQGYMDAVKWMKDPANWQEYQKILNTVTYKGDSSAPYSEVDLKDMCKSVVIHDAAAMKERNKSGGGLESYLKEVKVFLKDNGNLKKDFEPKDLFDNTAVIEAAGSIK